MEATSFAPDPSKCTVSASDVSLKLRGVSDSDNDFYTDTAETWPTPGRGTDSDAATATPSGAPDGSGEEALEAVSVEAALAAAASAVYVDPLGEDNVGRQLLLKMGWKQGKGLGLKGRGIREPIALEGEQKIYTREARAGLAHDSELNPFKKGEKPVSQLEKWEIAEKAADWMKGSGSSRWVAAGILGDSKSKDREKTKGEDDGSSPSFHRYVDAWDDKTYSELRSKRVSLDSEPDSPSHTWEDTWADGVNEALDKISLNSEHFFACCKVRGPLVKMLHIEPTGEVFQSKVWAANGRELRQVLEERLKGRLRVLRPVHLSHNAVTVSLFAVTQKASGDDEGLLNAEASRSQGCKVFGNVYLVCRSEGCRVSDYLLADYMRNFSEP